MRRALYEIVDTSNDRLVIRDIGHDCGRPTVTNDAEAVVAELHCLNVLAGRKLLYYDSSGDLDELVHDGAGNFVGFAPGPRR